MPDTADFRRAYALTAVYEGGYVFNRQDKGGETNRGITAATLSSYRKAPVTSSDMKNLTEAEAQAIYQKLYWSPLRCDDYFSSALSAGVFDCGVLTGVANASRMLQAAVGATVDGNVGPKTLAAVRAADTLTTCLSFSAAWQKYLLAIVERDNTQAQFLIGWLRRASSMQAYFYTFRG